MKKSANMIGRLYKSALQIVTSVISGNMLFFFFYSEIINSILNLSIKHKANAQ